MIKRRSFFLIVAATLLAVCSSAQGQTPSSTAPLGLKWGSSVEAMRAEGIELKEFPSKEYGISFIATKLNKTLADQSTTFLSFGLNNKLWRVVIVSRDFNNDPSGSAVVGRYSELAASLKEKYGKPTTVQQLGGSIYSQPRYFLSGIRGGESKWYSNYKTPDMQIQLGLIASDGSTGAWRLIYENLPLSMIFEASKKDNEKEKL